MKIVTSITLLAMLFVLVLAGTLSGAFGVEENLVQNGSIQPNVANAADCAGGAGTPTYGVNEGNTVGTHYIWTSITCSTWWGSGDKCWDEVTFNATGALKELLEAGYCEIRIMYNITDDNTSYSLNYYVKSNNKNGTTLASCTNNTAGSYFSNWVNVSASTLYFYFKYGGSSTNGSTTQNIGFEARIKSDLSVFSGDGTSVDPYKLTRRLDFDFLSGYVARGNDCDNLNFKVQPDTSIAGQSDGKTIAMNGSEFTPIGNGTTAFKGILEGNNCTVTNFNTNANLDNAGLFGVVNGTIKNLTVSNFTINNNGKSNHGGLVGSFSGTIENCHVVNGAVWGNANNGGLIGTTTGTTTIKNCTTASNVTVNWNGGSSNTTAANGGIVGLVAAGTTISNCTNNATVRNENSDAVYGFGGIVGYCNNTVTITNCTNNGSINGRNETGGIVGYANTGNITSCTNTGNVSGIAVVGGIAGKVVKGYITGGKSTATITTSGTRNESSLAGTAAYLGGIVGIAQCAVSNCYVGGKVTTNTSYGSSNVVGGIVGYASVNVDHCYVSATVEGSSNVGGLVGQQQSGNVRYSYFNGTIRGLWTNSGAAIGYIVGANNNFTQCWRLPAAKSTAASNVTYKAQGNLFSTSLTYYPLRISGSTHTQKKWEDITTTDINGFAASTSVSKGEYLSSTSDGGASTIVPSQIIDSATANSTTATEINVGFRVTYGYAVGYSSDVYVSKKNITQESKTVQYSAAPQYLNAPTSPNIASSGYQYTTLYYDDLNYSTLGTLSRINAGIYYTVTDIKLGGKVVGRQISYNNDKPILTILKKALSIDFVYTNGSSPYTYNAQHQGVWTATLKGFAGSENMNNLVAGTELNFNTSSSGTGCTISREGNVFTVGGAISVGAYGISISLDKATNYTFSSVTKNWEIRQKTLTATSVWTSGSSPFTYNAQHQGVSQLTISGFAEGESLDSFRDTLTFAMTPNNVTVEKNGNVYTFSNAITVGNYGYTFKLTESTNYTLVDKTESWSIGKKTLTATSVWTSGSSPFTYNAQHQGVSQLTISGFAEGESLDSFRDTLTFAMTPNNVTVVKNGNVYTFSNAIVVGNYGYTFKLTDSTNYTLADKAESWQIVQRELTFGNTWTDNSQKDVFDRTSANNFIYNGKLQGLSSVNIYGSGTVNGSSLFKIEGEKLQKNAGTYTRIYTIQDTHNYYVLQNNQHVTQVVYTWKIAKNQITMRNAWTSDPVNTDTDYYNFTFNGAAQGIVSFDAFAQQDTDKNNPTRPDFLPGVHYSVAYSSEGSVNVGIYTAILSILGEHAKNFEFVDSMTESYVATIPAIGSTDNIIGRKGVSVTTNAITYSWNINQFDVGNAFANKKAWFGAGTDMVVANQNTVNTQNVNGTEFAYYYLQAAASDTPKVIVYQNDKYIKDNFVLYVQYTTKTNGVEAHRLVKLVYGTDYTIADLTTAGDKHVADATVTASGTGNFVGNAVKYYVVADSDFGGNVNQANWGSESNPYVIEHESQLLRLSQIVNGGMAWNSINGADGLVANTDAQATNRTYEGCYFVVKANVTLLQSSASGIEGFEPIGSAAYKFKAAQFAKGDGLDSVSIEYSFSDTAREYVGLFGYIDGTSIVGIDIVGVGTIKGNKYVGGIVGYANGGKIEQCNFSVKSLSQDKVSGGDYVGGIVGYANGMAIVRDWNENTYGELMQASVSGVNYVGGIAGEWIVTNANQINGNSYKLSYAANLISVVGTGSYTGGIAGKLDASGCTTDLTYLGFYTNGKAGTGSDDVMDVYGTNYVGALFGAFIGNGYHYDADNLGVRSVILVKSFEDIRANVIANGDGAGYVMGGLIGYAEKVGILIGCNWTSESMVKNGSIAKTGVYVDAKGNTSFVGGLVGVLGENATIESVKQEVAVVGGTATISGGQYSVINKIAINGKDFVGGLIGYIASSAGSYFGTTGTILGNSIKFYNEAEVKGANYVGGIVGGLGIVDGYANFIGSDSDDVLKNLLSATHNSKQSILGYSTLESDPYTQNPFGKLINAASVTGSGSYVGGIFGYVGDRVNLALENAPISTVMNVEQLDTPYGYLNVYNGNKGKMTDGATTIKGANYVGGIAGWLDNQAHDLTFVVNRSKVNGTTYAGGLVGYMRAGTITSSIAVAPEDVTTTTNTYIGTTYIGGLVGYVDHGTISGSMSTGFLYGNVNANNGGIIGNGISPTIENSWTIYVAKDATYSTVSTNDRGKYLLLDSSVENVPSLLQIVRMTGLYVADMTYLGNTYTVGKLLVNVSVPSANNNKQLAFYDVSGSDNVTDNMSVDGSGNVTATNFTKFGNFNDTDPNALTIEWAFDNANSFSVCTVAIEFVNIPNYKDKEYNQNTAAGKKNAQDAYREPSASKLYVADVTNAEYWWYKDGDSNKGVNNEGQIKKLTAVIYFKYQNTLIKVGETGNYRIGDYDKDYSNDSIGSKENPIIISTQAQWNEFAYSIYTGAKTYSGQYIKLTTDIAINNSSHTDTNDNNLDFGAVASVPANGTTAPDNLAYNFAGNVHYDNGDKSFQGNFDGNGHTITINYVSGGYYRISVFPNAKNATFKNLTVDGQIMAASQMNGARGVYVTAAYDVAGFVGKPFGNLEFTNCINKADIIGLRNVAGILGYNPSGYSVKLESCVNTGDITSLEGSFTLGGETKDNKTYSYDDGWGNKAYSYGTGGIIGGVTGDLTIESCRNAGNITGGHNVGGIIGYSDGTGTGSGVKTLIIDSCANTGVVTQNSGNWNEDEGGLDGDESRGTRMNIFGYAGGIVGRTGEYALLKMYASYNSGKIIAYANISGGLVGGVGYMGQGGGKKNSVVTPGKSVIAYCYNTGVVYAGGTFPKDTENWGLGQRENHGGDIVGGIAGLVGNILVTDCYNTGDITAFGITGYGGSWQLRAGGIVGQADPVSSDQRVEYNRCINIGIIYSIHIRSWTGGVSESVSAYNSRSHLRYGASISGYCDDENSSSDRISESDSYSLAFSVHVKAARRNQSLSAYKNYASGGCNYFTDDNGNVDRVGNWLYVAGFAGQGNAKEEAIKTGYLCDNIQALTAVIRSDGKLAIDGSGWKKLKSWNNYDGDSVTYTIGESTSSIDANLASKGTNKADYSSGWIYIYGCLPQLAVFALDTYNGLSMRSVNYGRNIYGEYEREKAGDKYSPYIIKDGVDLLGLQKLVDLGYDFSGKYIEFANGINNLTKDVTKNIDMNDGKYSATNSLGILTGKSYHLQSLGKLWTDKNYYYNQETGTMTAGATRSTINFVSIGRYGSDKIFKGSISGRQSDGSNTEIARFKIISSDSDYAFAGLFARAESANISYISVSGSMKAYATNGKGHSIVGGIAADISGNTVIDHCNAGTTSRSLTLEAHGKNDAYSSSTVDQLHTYAGGIVGIANTSFYTGSTHVYRAGTTSVVKNCNTVYATVQSAKNNIGGVVGYASATSLDGKQNADGKNNKIEITDNVVTKAELYAFTASGTGNSDIGTKVGGVLGYSDKYIAVIISGCTVGTDSASGDVKITGENAIGGIVGAMPNAINEIKDCAVKASTLIQRGNSWGSVENVNDKSAGEGGDHGTAIGGIIGYTYHNTAENAVTTTLSGNISFAGTIKIEYATQDDAVRNVGGVFGDMASGASFATGAVINVSGAIEVADSIKTNAQDAENSGVRNIGGVAGRTRGVAFSGNFTVSATINIPNAYYVGGFIGRNRGEVNILADDTTINIGAKLNGAHDVGGFIGNNDASTGAILYIGANEYRRTRYEKPLSIVISQEATISASGDNVGGIVGGNTSNGGATVGAIRIVKGSITNNGTVSGANAVGGIIGNNNAGLVTGGGTGSDAVKKLTIVNGGAVSGNNYIGGVIGKLNRGTIAGTFVNNGDVTGQLFVGGSIGYVAFDAVITVAGGVATEFKNGAKEDAYTVSGDALTAGDTAAQGVGTVKGKAYVGGSIGIMLGKIVGNANAKVVFTSSGIVDASDVAGYLGGSIGAIAGQVDYAQFISTGELKGINAITAVGGSVGFIGAPTPLLATTCHEEYAIDINGALFNRVHIKNSHFESNGASLELTGTRVNEAKYNGNVQRQDHEWGGVGGAIGVITGVANGFDGGDDWKDNTYYAQGSVTAPGVYNVGGIVGFISANNIIINNMLAYDIDVTGGSNVGGIIGFTKGEKTVIANAFAISTSDSTGKYTAEYTKPDGTKVAGLAGGIIGKAADDTDASTSYWVKGYKNAELAGTNVNDLKNTLGRYTAITETIGQTTIIFTKELIGGTDVAEPVYPTPYEYLSAYYEEGQTHTVNGKSLTIADTFEYNEETQVTTYKDWDWYFETYYKDASSNDTKVVKTTDGTWVYEKNTWAQYSTGTVNTGWYFVYANDAAGNEGNVGTVNAKHTDKRSTQGEYTIVDRDFWKRIANAYTASEKEKGLNDPSNANYKLNSDIVLNEDEHGNKAPLVNNLYATATAATKSGYYLYIASSGDSRPTAINQDGKFYIQINTVDVDNAKESAKLAKNVAVYYRSIAMGSALTYNGYNRYAPISLQKDIKSEPGITDGKKVSDPKDNNSYAYTTELVEPQTVAKTVGTYKSNVFVYYYDDTGTAYKVGGITQGAWKIKQRVLTMSTEGTTSATYGDDNIATTVYIDNIVYEDINKLEFILSVTGSENVTIKYGVHDWSSNGVSIALVSSDASKSLSGSDANFNTDTIEKNTYKLKFTVNFTNAKKYSLSVALADNALAKNYSLNNAEKDVEVKRRELKIKGPVGGSSDNGKDEVTYDGNEHGATWTVEGIVKKPGYNDTISSVFKYFNPQFVVRIRKDPNKDEYLSPASFDLVQKGTATVNKRDIEFGYSDSTDTIVFSKAVDAGNYYLAFTNCEDNASNETNYYIKYEQSDDYTPNRPKSKSFTISTNMLTVTWASTSTSHVYEPGKKGVLTAKVVAKESINDFKTFVEKYFETSWTNLKGTDISISAQSDNKNATITFTTGENAGTYTANVKVKERTDQDVVNCGCNNATPTKSYKIDRKTITISFLDDGKKTVGSIDYEYNTDVQGLKTISISGLYSNQSVMYNLNVTSNDAKVQYGGKSYSQLQNSGSADLSGRDWINAGTYTATLTLGTDAVSNNYQLTSNNTSRVATAQWKITQKEIKINSVSMSNVTYDAQPHKPTFSLSIGTSSTGTYTWHNDTISINYKSGSVDAQAFVNAGKYNVSVAQNAISAKRGSIDTTANYIVDSSSISTISFEIYPRQITLTWDTTITSFVYTGNYSGLKVSDAVNEGTHYKVSGATLDSVKINACGNDVITVSLKGKQTEVNPSSSTYKMSYDKHSVTGTNYGEQSVASNYTFGEQSSDPFNITPSILTIKSVGGSTTKVYDANKKVTDTSRLTFVVGSSNGGANGENGFFTFEGEYEDKHVGEGKKVTLKFTFTKPTSGNYIVNESELVDNVIVRELAVGSITPKELEVKLDKLRSGKATRVYNGETWYGGENGATYSSGTSARSAVYRSGEGFIVDGFPTAEQNGTVKISANYQEVDRRNRAMFDSYVNFVYGDDANGYQKGTYTSGYFKTLVFSISGTCAQNYTFKVTNGTDAYSDTVGKAGQSVTVYDSRDEQNKDKRPANAGNINIEITVKSFKVEYTNTSQSYANSDNTYNTDWKAVEAIKTPTGTTVTVLNGWMYENGENGAMKTYNKYTVIRGRMGSKQLSAQVSGEKGMEHNYNMSNQPILTIGYFVDKTDFEVGSIASLMIASYYWYASEHADSPDFTPIVSAGSEWVSIVANDVYGTGAFGESNKPADAPKDCNSWDEYFAYIEQKENVTVFLNEYESNSWGYYKTTQTTTKPTYTSYRQTADFTGIVKQADIEILNNFFTTYTPGEDGAAIPTQQTWGSGGTYITNFLKPSVGNVLTALGSVFVSTGDGFGGTYNGNGYVIEYLNIYGFGGATQNVGMFDKIGNGSVSGLHLRNVTISANGGNVGGIAGEILAGEASSDVTNVSFHGSITVSGSGNVGGLFGKSARKVEKAIVLGTITANGGNVAGVVGSLSGTLSSVVSLMQVDASGTVAPIANGGTVNDSTYLANAVWSKDGNGKIAYAGGNGTAKSYAELMGGSTSGYEDSKYYEGSKYYYAGDTPNQKGVYDVIDDVALTSIDVQNNSNPRQSMRLRDVVDVYLLMYSLSETTASGGDINGARTYTISTTSWLVGDKHGTSKADAIEIANKQNVALLRQLRFATFVLNVDLASYEAQSFGGAFYGTIYQNGHSNPTDWLKTSFADVTNATIVNE